MHCTDCQPSNNLSLSSSIPIIENGSVTVPIVYELQLKLDALTVLPKERHLGKLIAAHVAKKRIFYGIEVMAHSYKRNVTLDYGVFGSWLPLFTSFVWLGVQNHNVENIGEVASLRLARQLSQYTVVMPHFSCYGANHRRLSDFLQLEFNNILALRGDQLHEHQKFSYASELVKEIRKMRADTVSIGVAGYPEGHPESKSLKEDMHFLKRKVHDGADFIITQICFSATAIIDFVRNCRQHGITVPILIGVHVPDNYRALQRLLEMAHVQMPALDFEQYKELLNNTEKFQELALQKTVDMLATVLAHGEVDVYGLQFFTINHFDAVPLVLKQLYKIQKLQQIYNFELP